MVIVATPLLILLLWRQRRHNTMGAMLYGYVALLFAFIFMELNVFEWHYESEQGRPAAV